MSIRPPAGGGGGVSDHGALSGLTDDDHTQYILKTLLDANTVLGATADDTPIAIAVAASRFLGRKASGDVTAMTVAEAVALLASSMAADSAFTGTYVPQAWRSIKRKASQTSRSGTTTVTDDPDLVFSIGANEIWVARWELFVEAANNTPDFKFTIAGPSGATGAFGANGFDDNVTASVADIMSATHALGATTRRGVTSTAAHIPIAATIVNGANAGTVSLQWAQNTSDGGNSTRLNAHSHMVADRIS